MTRETPSRLPPQGHHLHAEQKQSEHSASGSGSSVGQESLVKWLYPTELMSAVMEQPGEKPAKPETDAQEMQALTSSSSGNNTSTGGPDSDAGSVDELPVDDKAGVTGDISRKMTDSANYLGSMFSSAWTKTAKTANDATATGSSLLSSALTKVTVLGTSSGAKPSTPNEETAEEIKETTAEVKTPNEENGGVATAANAVSSYFSSAFGNLHFYKTSKPEGQEQPAEGDAAAQTEAAGDNAEADSMAKRGLTGLSSALSKVGKAAAEATHVIKDKVGAPSNMLSEFSKEQENFIKSKGHNSSDVGLCPWVGYQGEDELRTKIVSLSEDKRNFVRAPPSGVTFEFDYASVSSTALALLHEDARLEKMRYELVPKTVKEEEFWRNYFYRVNLIKQSFELKNMAEDEKQKPAPAQAEVKKVKDSLPDDVDISGDQDDEFVSESYQASTTDIAEVDESMKKLGVGNHKDADEWEAELEGELNEFEMVAEGKDEDNPEWESQIQEMLDAEDGLKQDA